MSGRDTASLETGAGAKAANNSVDDLSEVIRSLDKKAQGEYSLRLLLAARSPEQLRDTAPAVHRIFVDARAQVMEETLGNLSAFYAMFPGNHKFNVFPLWLAEDHHARLSSVFAPHLGHPHSEDLDAEYLNIFETRTRTPFFQDVYVDGVRVMLIIGPTGTGKSVHGNQIIALEQKYGGFTYIFDIGGSYESVVELYGGRVDRVGKDGPRVNPFALEPTESNIKFLYSFIKLLLTNGGAELEPEDDDVIHKAVQDMYLLDPENRRLSNLFLPKKLDRYLSKWVGKGVYNAIFDNVEDSLSLSRLQCFDFQGVNNEQYADLIEPLMVWLLRRINDVLYNPANLGVPKHILIEEIFSSMKNKQLLEGALASIKTVRKNLGGVTMIGQSADDLGANADSIVNSCTSFLFLKDATFNRKRYAELFKMNEQQIALFESLQDREGAVHAARRPHQSRHAESRQPQLCHVLHQAEGPGAPVEADCQVRTHRGHRALCPGRDRVTNLSTERASAMKPLIPIIVICRTCASLCHCDLPRRRRTSSPPAECAAHRHGIGGGHASCDSRRPAAIDADCASRRGEGRQRLRRGHGGLGLRWRPCRQPLHQRQAQEWRTARRTFTSSPTTATSTPCSCGKSPATTIPTSIPRSSSLPATRPRRTGWPSCRSSCPPPSWTRRSRRRLPRRPREAAELKAEETKAEQYRSQYPGILHFDYTWDQAKGKALGLQQIWRDDKFTYLRGQFQETPALYEVKDRKGSLINFDFNAGLYTVPKELENGYLAIGKQKVEFHRTEERN